ncbi:MAG: ANTAR domain-containing protein, partial [Nocardioidaceae bacterium]
RVRLADGSGFEERHWTADNWPVLAEDGSLVAIVHRVEVATAGRGDPFGMYDALLVEVDQLGEALVSRADIDQAKGIVMAERRCTPEQAFDVLVRMSQDTNVKVRDVATAIVYRTGHPVSSTDGMPYSVAPGTRNGARSRSGTRSRSL